MIWLIDRSILLQLSDVQATANRRQVVACQKTWVCGLVGAQQVGRHGAFAGTLKRVLSDAGKDWNGNGQGSGRAG